MPFEERRRILSITVVPCNYR